MKQNVGGLVASKHRLENSLAFQKGVSVALCGGLVCGMFTTITQFALLQKLLRCTEELSSTALKICANDVREKDNFYTVCGLISLASAILFARTVYQNSKKAKV